MNNCPSYKSYSSYELTPEQNYAVHLSVSRRENLKINALAGTGKTSTLRAIAKNLPQHRILYLAFNKTVQLEAQETFPTNVVAKTVHSLAYRGMSIFDSAWQEKLRCRWTIKHYASFLGMRPSASSSMTAIHALRDALKNFLYSGDLLPSSKHIPASHLKNMKSNAERKWLQELIDTQAPLLWEQMSDPKQKSVSITHDGYLKLWQLNSPVIRNVDIVMLDEAQDANPVMIDILKKQKCRLILVGDTWQQIYSFRGAINAMDQIKTPLSCYLTQSFRFGHTIASLANTLLKTKTGSPILMGNPKKMSVLGRIRPSQKHTIVFRTNIELLEEAWDLATQKIPIHISGSLEQTASLIWDVYRLLVGEHKKIRDPKIKHFKSWRELEVNVDILDDIELKKGFHFVERYMHDIPTLIESIKGANTPSEERCRVHLITGHKSKGKEWENVRISEDFYDAVMSGDKEEKNLLYVAITRAIRLLEVPPLILEFLTFGEEESLRDLDQRI